MLLQYCSSERRVSIQRIWWSVQALSYRQLSKNRHNIARGILKGTLTAMKATWCLSLWMSRYVQGGQRYQEFLDTDTNNQCCKFVSWKSPYIPCRMRSSPTVSDCAPGALCISVQITSTPFQARPPSSWRGECSEEGV